MSYNKISLPLDLSVAGLTATGAGRFTMLNDAVGATDPAPAQIASMQDLSHAIGPGCRDAVKELMPSLLV
jgi:hypothetical protein